MGAGSPWSVWAMNAARRTHDGDTEGFYSLADRKVPVAGRHTEAIWLKVYREPCGTDGCEAAIPPPSQDFAKRYPTYNSGEDTA